MKLLKIAGWTIAALIVLLIVGITATIGWRPFIGPSARALTDRTVCLDARTDGSRALPHRESPELLRVP